MAFLLIKKIKHPTETWDVFGLVENLRRYFCPSTNAPRGIREVVVMDMVPKQRLYILDGILCDGRGLVKRDF